MNNLYLSFIIINIFALYGYSYSAPRTPVFDNIDSRLNEACPVLNHNVLLDKHSEYLSKCNDVELSNAPKSIDVVNLKNFLCIGVFEAYIRLCNALSSVANYSYLPQTDAVLKHDINEISKLKSDVVCNEFKQIYPIRDNISTALLPWMTVLNANLREPICIRLCSDISQMSTNVLCSMLFYINQHIQNITTLKPAVEKVPTINHSDAIKPTKHDSDHLFSKPVLPTKKILLIPQINTQIDQGSIANLGTLEKGRETKAEVTHRQKTTNDPNSMPIKSKPVSTIGVFKKLQNVVANEETNNLDLNNLSHIKVSTEVHNLVEQVQSTTVQEKSTTVQEQSTDVPQELAAPSVPSPTSLSVPAVTNPKPSNDSSPVEEKPQIVEIKNDISPKVSEETNLSKDINENRLGNIFDTGDKDTLDTNGLRDYDDEDDDHVYLLSDASPIAEKNQEDSVQIRPVDSSGTARHYVEVEDSNFFSYFMFISVMFIFGYVVYHNKQKILALLLEGRRDRNARRRPSTSSYRKLNSNLEEAVTSKCSGSASNVIY